MDSQRNTVSIFWFFFETYQYVQDAILREKRLKKWKRQWKIDLIEEENPDWTDLVSDWYD